MSQSDKGELVIGSGTDQYVSYSQRGGLPLIEHTGEDVGGSGSRLEAAGTPAAIHVEPRHRRLGDDRRARTSTSPTANAVACR
jgi:hypothetical protein